MPLALLIGCAASIGDLLTSNLASDGWRVERDWPQEGVGSAVPVDLVVLVEEMRSADPLPARPSVLASWSAVADIAARLAAERRAGRPGTSALCIVLVNRCALVADTRDPAYGIALAQFSAAIRSLALSLIPASRLNAVVADLDQSWMHGEAVAAVRLLEKSPSMTGVVLDLAQCGPGDDA